MKRPLCTLLILLLAGLCVGCQGEPTPPPVTDQVTAAPVTEVPQTTSPETTAPETTIPENREPIARKNLKHTDAGLRPFTVTSSNRAVAEGEPGKLATTVFAYADGTATLSFTDCFGHTSTCEVSVSGGEITLTPKPPAEDFIEVTLDYGANGFDSEADTAAIQAAISKAKPGDTVYLYPGIYNVGTIVMREGVTLEMYTTMTDASVGYTDELARQARAGEIAVLSGVRFMNNANNRPGAEGCSNFTIRGGLLDQKETGRGAIIFGCADGVLMENVILKDIKNNHAVQLTGCTNTTLRNCMFAGYTWGGTFTREVIQVETSHPGATGSADTAPLTFSNGEFYYCENIEITQCYFGKSDKCGAPLMAIGHHGHHGPATVTGFRITDNIFDEMLYAGIRYTNIVDTEISGNTFISTAAYPNIKDASARTPACIILYSPGGATTYTSVLDGKKITVASAAGQAGMHQMRITDNTFRLGAGTDKAVIHVTGTGHTPGLAFQSGVIQQKAYNTPSYSYIGYTPVTNCIEDLVFANNTVLLEGQPTYSSQLYFFQQVRGLTWENNTLTKPEGVSFSNASQNIEGLKTAACTMGRGSTDYVISTGPRGRVMLGDISMKAKSIYTVRIAVEGSGRLDIATDEAGNGSLTPIPAEGYRFDGWYDEAGQKLSEAITLTASAKLTARFTET